MCVDREVTQVKNTKTCKSVLIPQVLPLGELELLGATSNLKLNWSFNNNGLAISIVEKTTETLPRHLQNGMVFKLKFTYDGVKEGDL